MLINSPNVWSALMKAVISGGKTATPLQARTAKVQSKSHPSRRCYSEICCVAIEESVRKKREIKDFKLRSLVSKSLHHKFMGFYCYILECVDGSYYTGWTTDPKRREHQHNARRGARYTKTRRPVKLVYIESHPDRSTAQKREIMIKKLSRARKEALVVEYSKAKE
jgi:putative endonuclease